MGWMIVSTNKTTICIAYVLLEDVDEPRVGDNLSKQEFGSGMILKHVLHISLQHTLAI
jgi:hypothetical protein